MGPTEWIGVAVPLCAWTAVFTVLGAVTFRENRRDRMRPNPTRAGDT